MESMNNSFPSNSNSFIPLAVSVILNNNNTNPSNSVNWVEAYFHYKPSVAGCVFFLILYIGATLLTGGISWKHKSNGNYFMFIVAATGLAEVVGLAMRLYLAVNADNSNLANPLTIYATMSALAVISPNALALVNYIMASRLLSMADLPFPSMIMRPKLVAVLFLASDIFNFAMQGGASSLLVNADTAHTGETIIIISLIIQLCFFSLFISVVYRLNYSSEYKFLQDHFFQINRIFRCLWFTLIMLMIRSIYRLVEFSSGYDGPVATEESLVYIFDFLPVFLCFPVYAYDNWYLINESYIQCMNKDDVKYAVSPSAVIF